jgi:hypothetical protein
MTEAEWPACDDPRAMFDRVSKVRRFTPRRYRLFTAAFWHWQSYRLRAKREQDRLRKCAELLAVWADTGTPPEGVRPGKSHRGFFGKQARSDARSAAISPYEWGNHGRDAIAMLPDLIREVFGNPFRRIRVNPAWLTSTVTELARGIYEEGAFDRLPILADALQDAGCEDADILDHCRSAGPHVRGCWVVDLVLGNT